MSQVSQVNAHEWTWSCWSFSRWKHAGRSQLGSSSQIERENSPIPTPPLATPAFLGPTDRSSTYSLACLGPAPVPCVLAPQWAPSADPQWHLAPHCAGCEVVLRRPKVAVARFSTGARCHGWVLHGNHPRSPLIGHPGWMGTLD